MTEFTYDAAGRMTSLTDPEDNTTSWTFDPLGRVATETITVSSNDLIRTFRRDAAGNLIRKIDRGRTGDRLLLDSLSRRTAEAWYDNETDADAEQNLRKTYSTTTTMPSVNGPAWSHPTAAVSPTPGIPAARSPI